MNWDAELLAAQLGKLPHGLNDDDAAEQRVRRIAPETTTPALQQVACIFVDSRNRILAWYLPGIFAGGALVGISLLSPQNMS